MVCGGAVDIFYDILRYLTKNMFSNFWKRLTFIIAQAGFELMPFIFVAYSIFFKSLLIRYKDKKTVIIDLIVYFPIGARHK